MSLPVKSGERRAPAANWGIFSAPVRYRRRLFPKKGTLAVRTLRALSGTVPVGSRAKRERRARPALLKRLYLESKRNPVGRSRRQTIRERKALRKAAKAAARAKFLAGHPLDRPASPPPRHDLRGIQTPG